jgi:hypothetical protein
MMSNHPGRVDRRPESLADRASVINLLAAYAHFANIGDIEGWADCFTADATYQISAPGAPGEPIPKAMFVAAEAPQFAAYRRMLADPMTGERKIYCIVNPYIVSLDSGTARVVAELVQLRTGAATTPRIQLTGTYQGELIRTEDIWRIRRWEVQTTRQPESVSEVPALWWLNVATNADGDWRNPS